MPVALAKMMRSWTGVVLPRLRGWKMLTLLKLGGI